MNNILKVNFYTYENYLSGNNKMNLRKILNKFSSDNEISFFSLLLDDEAKHVSVYLRSDEEIKNIPSYNIISYNENSYFRANTEPIENYREVGMQFAEYIKNSRNKFFYLIIDGNVVLFKDKNLVSNISLSANKIEFRCSKERYFAFSFLNYEDALEKIKKCYSSCKNLQNILKEAEKKLRKIISNFDRDDVILFSLDNEISGSMLEGKTTKQAIGVLLGSSGILYSMENIGYRRFFNKIANFFNSEDDIFSIENVCSGLSNVKTIFIRKSNFLKNFKILPVEHDRSRYCIIFRKRRPVEIEIKIKGICEQRIIDLVNSLPENEESIPLKLACKMGNLNTFLEGVKRK